MKLSNPSLRQHQRESFVPNAEQMAKGLTGIRRVIRKGNGKGRIVLPTGTGKTMIEAKTIVEIIQELQIEGVWGGVHVVLSPRILLAYQQLDEFIGFLGRDGIDCEYMVVNSGGLNSVQYESKLLKMGFDNPEEIESTTCKATIIQKIESARKKNLPLILFSTYHSVGRVEEAAVECKVDIQSYIFDEAQYCVSSGDFQHVPNFASIFKFFFTATEKYTDSDDGLGMNNEKKFGKLLFIESPKTLIERGEMASVAIHLVGSRGQTIKDDDYEAMAKVVVDAFDKHRIVMKAHAFLPDTIGPKMIVVCDKQDSLRGIMRSKTMKDYRMNNPGVTLCGLSSEFGIEVNGVYSPRVNNKNKEVLIAKMRGLKPEDEAIVLHVDMIAEGLDVPGITAVMPFRNLSKIKFLQNLGRGTRLVSADRERLYSGDLQPMDWKTVDGAYLGKYIKPYCWLVLPVLSSDYYDAKRRYQDYIDALRSEYGFNSSEMVVIDNIVAPPEDKPLEDMVGKRIRKFVLGAGLIGEIVHEIEDAEAMTEFMDHSFTFNLLSPAEQINLLREIYNKETA